MRVHWCACTHTRHALQRVPGHHNYQMTSFLNSIYQKSDYMTHTTIVRNGQNVARGGGTRTVLVRATPQ